MLQRIDRYQAINNHRGNKPATLPIGKLGGFWNDAFDLADDWYQTKIDEERKRQERKQAELDRQHELELERIRTESGKYNGQDPPPGYSLGVSPQTGILAIIGLGALWVIARR